MNQLLILSGKGGTGKTTVAGALIALGGIDAFADCDVDAPNLHLVIPDLSEPEKDVYHGFGKAVIDRDKCVRCGLCGENCRFEAIRDCTVSLFECEGCGVCQKVCPVGAVSLTDHPAGSLMLYKDPRRTFSTAELSIGSGTSGKLVTEVKKRLVREAPETALAVIDGSPGIGCPVVASISGADLVLIVSEPTVSGIHDMKRIVETVRHFGASCAVCINKFDINPQSAQAIEDYCSGMEIPLVGKIPFDATVVKAVNECRSIADYPESPAGRAIAAMWQTLCRTLL